MSASRRLPPLLAVVLLASVLMTHPVQTAAVTPPGAVPRELQLIPARGAPRMTLAWEQDGVTYISAHAMAVLLDATEIWRAELGRLTFATDRHEMVVMADSDIAVVDATRLVHLPGPVFLWEEEILVPLALVVTEAGRPRPWVPEVVRYSREHRRLSAARHEGVVTDAHIERDAMGWKLVLVGDRPLRYTIARTERASFVVRVPGLEYDPLLYPLPSGHDWFRGLRIHNLADGLEVSFSPGPGAMGYRIQTPATNRVDILLGVDERDLREGTIQPFAAGGRPMAGMPSVVVLDPGHGGADPGADLGKKNEARLAYDLALRVASGLSRELDVDVVVTREESRGADVAGRVAAAESYHADLMVSLHLHDRPGGPAAFTAAMDGSRHAPPPELGALGFRASTGGQATFVPASRLLARTVVDAVAANLEEQAQGVFAEDLPLLRGVAMPAMVLELGRGDDERGWSDSMLDEVAEGIIEGIRLYVLFDEEVR